MKSRVANNWLRVAGIFAVITLLIGGWSSGARAQGTSRTFLETGKTVSGVFLQYWDEHGGLAQQGYPLTDEMQEVSATDGKTYTVQYFERAVFELHPENAAPNNVLLSLLGVFQYKQKYPGGALGQTPSSAADARKFDATGHSVGGKFLDYWNTHGGLAQQGYPISDEFQEVSDTNGQTYTVQYFERAVFELHPENAGTPYEVLLSQLGKTQYRQRYQASTPTEAAPTATTAPEPSATPTAAPTVALDDCSDVPASQGVEVSPNCGPLFSTFDLKGTGFTEDAEVGVWSTMPNGEVFGAPFHVPIVKGGETVGGLRLYLDDETPYYGIWTVTMEGIQSHRRAYGYFKLYPPVPKTPTR